MLICIHTAAHNSFNIYVGMCVLFKTDMRKCEHILEACGIIWKCFKDTCFHRTMMICNVIFSALR